MYFVDLGKLEFYFLVFFRVFIFGGFYLGFLILYLLLEEFILRENVWVMRMFWF